MQQISPTVWLLFRIRIFDYRLFQKVNRLKDTIAISEFSEKVYVPRMTYFDLTRVKIHKLNITLLKTYYVILFFRCQIRIQWPSLLRKVYQRSKVVKSSELIITWHYQITFYRPETMIFEFYDLKLARSTSIQSHFNKFWNSYDILKLTRADLWWPRVVSTDLMFIILIQSPL